MFSAHTCLRCRQHFSRKLAPNRRGIGFVSLNRHVETSNESPLEDRNSPPAPKEDERDLDSAPTRSRQIIYRPKTSEFCHSLPRSTTDSALEDLFESNQRQKPPPRLPYLGTSFSPSAATLTHSGTPTNNVLYSRAAQIIGRLYRQLHHDKGPIQDVWRTWKRLFAMGINSDLQFLRHGVLNDRAGYLARKFIVLVARNKVQPEGRQAAPSLSEVIYRYEDIGILGDRWLSALWPLLAEILKLVHGQIVPRSKNEAFELMVEVLSIWSAFISRPSRLFPTTRDTVNEPMEISVPSDDDSSPLLNRQSRLVRTIVKACEDNPRSDKDPSSQPGLLRDAVEVCTVTHLCLKEVIVNKGLFPELPDHCRRVATLDGDFAEHHKITFGPRSNVSSFLRRENVAPHIINAVENVSEMRMRGSHVYENAPMPSKVTTGSTDTLKDTGHEHITSSIALLELREQKLAQSLDHITISLKGNVPTMAAEVRPLYQKPPIARRDNSDIHRAMTTMIIDLQRAVTQHDVARVAAIWQRFRDTLAKRDLESKSREQIYIAFLTSFWTLSRAQQAVHVWNDMLQAGITPNQKHWNAMLTGASKVRDSTSLEEIWKKMIAAGSEPDQASWTTYINGLILCGKWQRGLQVLDNLGKVWLQGQQDWQRASYRERELALHDRKPLPERPPPSDPNTATRPFLAVINAAISALIAIQRYDRCPALLEWALTHSLPLTTPIFNSLLRPAARASDNQTITYIFSMMRSHSCTPDTSTYRILLNGYLSNPHSSFPSLPPEAQESKITSVLNDMKTRGLVPDQRIYSTILYGLLSPKNPHPNAPLAKKILALMTAEGIPLNTYMYSILISHYFALSPPDTAAVDALWRKMRFPFPILDRAFYEKMVAGYASVRNVERMLYFLLRLPREGKAPGWRCVKVVVETLVECEEWGLLGEVVRDLRDGREGLRRWADEDVESEFEGEVWGIVEGVRGRIDLGD